MSSSFPAGEVSGEKVASVFFVNMFLSLCFVPSCPFLNDVNGGPKLLELRLCCLSDCPKFLVFLRNTTRKGID